MRISAYAMTAQAMTAQANFDIALRAYARGLGPAPQAYFRIILSL